MNQTKSKPGRPKGKAEPPEGYRKAFNIYLNEQELTLLLSKPGTGISDKVRRLIVSN